MGYWDTHPVIEDAPIIPPYVPTFRSAAITDGTNFWPLNFEYFADHSTAEKMATLYGDGKVYEFPFPGSGGPFQATANIYCIKDKTSGRYTNAGVLAAYYLRNPQDKFPGLADKLIRLALGLG